MNNDEFAKLMREKDELEELKQLQYKEFEAKARQFRYDIKKEKEKHEKVEWEIRDENRKLNEENEEQNQKIKVLNEEL